MKTPLRLLNCILVIALSCFFQLVKAQAPAIEWQKSLGGSELDQGNSIQQTIDGGYIVAGYSNSNDGDISGNHPDSNGYTTYDFWVAKLDSSGNVLWQKSLGGSAWDLAYSLQQTTDSGFIVAGYSKSDDGDVSGHHGSKYHPDYWIVKLNSSGNILWQKSLGGSDDEEAYSVQQTSDGGFIVAGWSNSIDGDVTGNHGNGNGDYWIVKLDSAGNISWQKSLGGSDDDEAYSIQQTTDEGYIVAGYSNSDDGDVSGNHLGNMGTTVDCWIVKLDSSGNIIWQKSLGGSSDEVPFAVQQTTDGGFVIASETISNDGDVSGNHFGNYGYTSQDAWIVKLDASGNIIWQKCLGGSGHDAALDIQQDNDGKFIVAVQSDSNDGDVFGNQGTLDYWIVELDSSGNIIWQKSFGGSGYDIPRSIVQTSDEGFIVAGYSQSNDEDVSGNHVNNYGNTEDYWIVKLSSDTLAESANTPPINSFSFATSPNPFSQSTIISFSLPQSQNVSLKIYDVEGRLIRSLVDVVMSEGAHSIAWNARDASGNALNAGVYFLKVATASENKTIQLLVIK